MRWRQDALGIADAPPAWESPNPKAGRVMAREGVLAKDNATRRKRGWLASPGVPRLRFGLLEQKKGKKRMKSIGSVNAPQEAFMAVLDQRE